MPPETLLLRGGGVHKRIGNTRLERRIKTRINFYALFSRICLHVAVFVPYLNKHAT